MIRTIQKELEPILAAHEGATGLFLSGGSDSLLLFHILIDMQAAFHCISLDHTFTREQRAPVDALIEKYDLRVFSYSPATMYLLGDGKENVTLVEEYAMPDGHPFPFFRDCRQDDQKCIHDTDLAAGGQMKAPIGFTLNLFGTRKHDRHYITGRIWRRRQFTRQGLTFLAPLWDLTRKDVRKLLKEFNTEPPAVDTAILPLCLKCLTAKGPVSCPRGGMVEPFAWGPQATLAAFRTRFGVSV